MKRKQYGAEFKSRVAIEAIKGHKTLPQIASDYQVMPNMVYKWKKQALEKLTMVFDEKSERVGEVEKDRKIDELYRQIGKLKVDNDFLKKTAYRD